MGALASSPVEMRQVFDLSVLMAGYSTKGPNSGKLKQSTTTASPGR